MSTVDHAVKLWTSLEHPKSLLNIRSTSYSLTRIFFGMTNDERAEYKERIWKIVQEKIRKRKAEWVRFALPEIFHLHSNGEYLKANHIFDTLIKLVA